MSSLQPLSHLEYIFSVGKTVMELALGRGFRDEGVEKIYGDSLHGRTRYDPVMMERFKKFWFAGKQPGVYDRSSLSHEYWSPDRTRVLYVHYANPGTKNIIDVKTAEFFFNQIYALASKYPAVEKQSIFISSKPLGPRPLETFEALSIQPDKGWIQRFMESDLLINPTHHVLTPTHSLMSLEETRDWLIANPTFTYSNLPKIYEEDPVIKFLGGRPGQVVVILRENKFKETNIPFTLFFRQILPGGPN